MRRRAERNKGQSGAPEPVGGAARDIGRDAGAVHPPPRPPRGGRAIHWGDHKTVAPNYPYGTGRAAPALD